MQNNDNNENKQKPKFRFDFLFFIVIILGIIGVVSLVSNLSRQSPANIDYTELVSKIENGSITGELAAKPVTGQNYGYKIEGKYRSTVNNEENSFVIIVSVQNLDKLIELSSVDNNNDGVKDYNFKVVIYEVTENYWLEIIVSFLPYLIIVPIFIYLMFRLMKSSGAGNAMDFGKSTARLSRSKTVTFNDVAGCDEEKDELVEIIDFLKNPRKYNEIGARIPKGVLLSGPPGTGKTLLAKAVAGEAGVPFFSISGSDFVEMFVGVGASRVRDMFKTAKQNAPCIIFIDEIDAVGRQRGAGMGGGHDEREQTLNQLLVEMDGFAPNLGIIVMAATNRPDVLDPALLRPGRFDRQITINNPDVRGREAILKVHARNKHLDTTISLEAIAQRTPGFSGADIENLLNEAALLAARDNRKVISIQDIDEAIDRVMMGPAKKSHKYTPKEMRMVAYHEAGHAVIGLKLKNASVVQKVTIIPRGQAGGYNLMMPKEETFTQSKSELLESITGYLGGRVAEEIMFNEISTGAYADIKSATRIARAMVAEYGMSDLGPVQYEERAGSVFLGRDYLKDKNFSDAVAQEIDAEVRKLIFNCHEEATKVIKENMDLLTNIAEYLLKIETLNKTDIDEIASTGHLGWYDAKELAKKQQEEAKARREAEANNAQEPKEIEEIVMPEEIKVEEPENKEEE